MKAQNTALLSAYDKTNLEGFASRLVEMGWNLLGSRGTVKALAACGIAARDVAEIVGDPILGHRVVTLSREIHAALLATDKPEDQAELDRLGIPRIGLVYVNFYPLREEIQKPDCTLDSVIEATDIGGPTLLRSAAKGRRLVVCRPSEFRIVLNYLAGKYSKWPNIDEMIISGLASIAEAEARDYGHVSSEYHRVVATERFFNEASLI